MAGGDGGVDTLTFLFPSFWLGTNTTETKVFLIFSPYNVSNIICRRIFQNDEIVDFCCSKSVGKAQKDVKNVEICKKLWKMWEICFQLIESCLWTALQIDAASASSLQYLHPLSAHCHCTLLHTIAHNYYYIEM